MGRAIGSPPAAALVAPSWIARPLHWQEHRLGVDFAAQARLNVRAFAWFVALPALAAALVRGRAGRGCVCAGSTRRP